MEAIYKEHEALQEHQVYEVTDLPPGRRALNTRWVFTKKCDVKGRELSYKARLVVRGDGQIPDVDFTETYALVGRNATFRLLLRIVTRKLKRSLYGLKQSGRNWYKHLTELLKGCCLNQSNADPGLFFNLKDKTFILIYVDDLLEISNYS